MGWGVCIYNPVREKKHCGRRYVLARSAFMPDAAVARRTTQRAHRLGLHTVAPPLYRLWKRTRPQPSGMAFGLRNASQLLSSGLQSWDACASYPDGVIMAHEA